MRQVSRTGLIATTLAIGAIVAPSAQAGLFSAGPDPSGAGQQEAQSFQRIYSAPASTPLVVRANPDEQVPASTLSVVATPDQATVSRDQLGDRQLSTALLRIAQVNGRNISSTPVVSATSSSHGFQYDDAAIGAGVMAGLVLLGIAGTLTVRRRGQLSHS
jgi:hypothetical protein